MPVVMVLPVTLRKVSGGMSALMTAARVTPDLREKRRLRFEKPRERDELRTNRRRGMRERSPRRRAGRRRR